MTMKKFTMVLMAMLMLLPVSIFAYDAESYKYELENVKGGASTAGYVIVKVWSYGRRERLTKRRCMANAVHGILFKGVDADAVGTAGAIPPLVPGGYESNPTYFDNFFMDDYLQYVQESNKGFQDVIKMTKKKEVKMGMVVKINVNALRKRLEKDGIKAGVQGLFTR